MSTPPVIKRSIFLLLSFIVITVAKAQTNSETVSIPDPNFEQALIDLGIDSDRNINGSVFLNDVKNIEVLEVPNSNISSLEGLSAFSNLRILRAWENQISSLDVSANILLVHLSVANNQITGLDLSANTALVEVYAYNNNLSDLQIAANNQLKHLSVSDNQLTELDLSGSSALVDVYINNNNLSVVNLGSHPYLSNFHAGGNQINAVDVTNLPALRSFLAWGSNLSEIDFTNNILLEEVDLNVNNLSSLDLSNNPNLNFVFCNSNNLKSLNISNGNNAGMVLPEWSEYTLDARGNPDLRCIQVDAEMVEANRTDWGKDTGAIYSSDCANKPEYISIPDPNFEQALIDLGVDTDGFLNTYLLLTDAESVTNLNLRLPVNFPYGGGNMMITNVNSSITDLTGIEAFVNLKELLVDSNDLESLDITGLSQLSLLYCSGNNLSQIDLSQNPELKYLRMNNNTLTQLDVSSNPSLELLIINGNNLAQIDLSGNSLLKDLQFLGNPISNMDILNLSELETLYCGKTNISSLDLSKNLKLKNLNIDELPISELDLSAYPHFERLWARNTSIEAIDFSKNSNLLQVWIENSPLKTLDLSNNAALFAVVLDNNLGLEHLDVRNGNNLAMNFFRLTNTPNLTCVNADANISQVMIDSGKNFSEDCGDFVYIADANFEQSLLDLGIDSDGVINQSILRSDAEAVQELNLTNPALVPENEKRYANPEIVNVEGRIQDLTGIEAFVNLNNLRAFSHELTSIDVSSLTELRRLELVNNQIASIDVSKNTKLEIFWLESNNLNEVDLTNNTELVNIALGYNNLTEVNVTQNTKLWALTIEGNDLTTVDVSQNKVIAQIWVAENPNLTHMDFSQNTEMYGLGIYNTAIKTLDLSNNPMTRLYAGNNPNLEHVDLRNGNNLNLNQFWVDNTPLLTCINADETISQVMIDSGKTFSEDCGDFVEIPDPNFEQALIDLGVDSDRLVNASILRSDAEAVTWYLDFQSPKFASYGTGNTQLVNVEGKIADLTGIEAFVNIQGMNLSDNDLTSLDLSNNTRITNLYVNDNRLTGINISNCPALRFLHLGNNEINSIDVSNNPLLEELAVINNNLIEIDISGNPLIKWLHCADNDLTSLNMTNGNNDKFEGPNWSPYALWATGNPDLSCIQVDSGMANNVPADWIKDPSAIYTSNCDTKPEYVSIPDPNFEQSLIDIGVDSDGTVNSLLLKIDAESLTDLNLINPNFVTGRDLRYANTNIENVDEKIQDLTGIEAFVNLTDLSVMSHAITGVDISNNILLENLNLVDNQISSIDVSNNTNLEVLWLESNELQDVDVSANTELVNLALGYNQLTQIDVTNNVKLWALTIEGNDLTTVDVSKNTVIAQIWVAENPNLTHMDFSKNTEMYGLGIYNTAIKTLDLSNNPMTRLFIGNNPNLEHVDLRNGNNLNLDQFWADNTPNLSCINADSSISQAMKDSGKSFSEDCGDFIYIADANFEQSLIDLGIDSDGVVNTSILREDAEAATSLNLNNPVFDNSAFANPEIVNVSGKIADLTGIEAFVSLKSLQVAYGALTEIDLSKNLLLEELFLNDNQLNSIDVSMLSNLKRFGIMRNEMTSGIDVSANPLLEELFVHETGISAIDLTANPYLWNLYIQGNDLSALDLSANTALTQLRCQNNNIAQLDISTLSLIKRIDAQYNPGVVLTTGANGSPTLTSLNLSGTGLSNFNGATYPNLEWLLLNDNALSNFNGNNNLLLQNLFLNNNMISKLSLTGNTVLAQLKIENNGLEELDLRNGNNMDLQKVEATGNILTCISVDAPGDDAMPYSQWQLDLGVILSINCKQAEEVVIIPDPNFEQALMDAGYDTNGDGAITGNILLSEAEAVTILDVSGRDITDATGIEAFVNLTELNISGNLLTAINLQENKALTALDISGNMLNELFIGNGKVMTSLNAADNDLDELNFAELINLQDLDISGNQFQSLDFRAFNSLVMLDVSSNQLTSLDLRNGNNLMMNYMDASGNLLSCIGVDDISSIPEAWTKDDGTSYTATGDCEDPIVQTRDITISLDRNGLAVIAAEDINDGSFDNMTDQKNLIFDLDITQFSCENLGGNEVSLFVTDASGNIGTATAMVSVIDEIVPDVSAVRSISLDLNGASFIELDPSALDNGSTDNCAGLDFSLDQSSFNFPGTYTVEFRATDLSGNSSSAYVDVEVLDSASEPTSLKFKKNVVATVYPNSFSDKLRITFSTLIDLDSVEVSLYTLSPSLTGVQFEVEDNEIVSTNADILPVGTYSLMIKVNGETQSALVIKEN